MSRVYNFSAGPSMLPVPVLEKAAGELLEYGETGQSVMEMSHRSAAFEPIINETQVLIREVMGIPDNYKVLFLQGGRVQPVCRRAHEPDDKEPQGRLCALRPVLHQGL